MDGIHDLGGLQGFGPVASDPGEPPFAERWEGRVHGMMLALGANGRLPRGFRYAIERMDPLHYLGSPYYEHWLVALETLLTEAGALRADDLDRWADRVRDGADVPARADPAAVERVRAVLRPFPVRRNAEPAPAFAVGDKVRVRRLHPDGHTRCPRYVRGAAGVVDRVHEPQPLPDAFVAGEVRVEPYYGVRFDADELWGGGGERFSVVVDLWESYLEEAP